MALKYAKVTLEITYGYPDDLDPIVVAVLVKMAVLETVGPIITVGKMSEPVEVTESEVYENSTPIHAPGCIHSQAEHN